VAGEGSCPRLGGFVGVQPVWGQGYLVVVWAGQLGEAGRDGGGENSPDPPVGPHLDCLPCCHAGVSSSLLVGKLIKAGASHRTVPGASRAQPRRLPAQPPGP